MNFSFRWLNILGLGLGLKHLKTRATLDDVYDDFGGLISGFVRQAFYRQRGSIRREQSVLRRAGLLHVSTNL